MSGENDRPEFVTDAMLRFLDETRASGRINIFGAPALLEDEFCLDHDEALAVCAYWAKTFTAD